MPATPAPLKYLFGAKLRDGSEFHQNAEDQSNLDSKRSSFYDLIHLHGLENVELFQLAGEGRVYLVDLRDGHFEVNGAPLYVGSCPRLDGAMPGHLEDVTGKWGPLRLIYFRRHREFLTINGVINPTGNLTEFHFGWQGLGPGDKNHQQTLILL